MKFGLHVGVYACWILSKFRVIQARGLDVVAKKMRGCFVDFCLFFK